MFGAGTVTPTVGQCENRFVKAGDAAIDPCHGAQVLLVLHRGLFKPLMQIQTVFIFYYPQTSVPKKQTNKKVITQQIEQGNKYTEWRQ